MPLWLYTTDPVFLAGFFLWLGLLVGACGCYAITHRSPMP